MNNDIARELPYNSARNNAVKNIAKPIKGEEQQNNAYLPNDDLKSSIDCLGAMGCAHVKMSNAVGVENSIKAFQENPTLVKFCMDIYDAMIEKGHNVPHALNVCEAVYTTLKDEDTYKSEE